MITLFWCSVLSARVIITPVDEYWMPFYYLSKCDPHPTEDLCILTKVWGIGYSRGASDAYDCNGRLMPLGTLIFGKSDFTFAQTLYNSSISGASTNNPWISTSLVSPRFEYFENGMMFGGQVGTTFCEGKYGLGMRARIPYQEIRVSEICVGSISDLKGDTLEDVFQTRREIPTGGSEPITVFAARLDFVTALNEIALTAAGVPEPMVDYANVTDATGQMTIASMDITGSPGVGTNNQPSVAAIKKLDGEMPFDQRWGDYNTALVGTVSDDGSGGANNQRLRFINTPSFYVPLGNSTANQRTLFIVPEVNGVAPNQNFITTGASAILSAIQASSGGIDSSITEYISDNGLDFCNGRTIGIGDLDLEFYFSQRWELWCEQFSSEVSLGFRCSTSACLNNCKKVLLQPLGTNGHTQVRLGAMVEYEAFSWMTLEFDGYYSWVLQEREWVAAPFEGAVVKNIGPCVPAEVSWSYFIGHLNLAFYANACSGIMIGYEPYIKQSDTITLRNITAIDFLGRVEPLDASVLTQKTHVVSHGLNVEFFLGIKSGQLFGGWYHVVAGSYAPRDTGYHLGLQIFF